MLSAVPDPRPGRSPRPRLTEMLFGSNHTSNSRFTEVTGATADIADVGFMEDGNWTLGCNQDRIGEGTIAFYPRFGNGGCPPLAGFGVCTEDPDAYEIEDGDGSQLVDANGNPLVEWSVRGRLHGWDKSLWVRGELIQASGWPTNRSPWGASNTRQFRNGERLTPDLVQIILSVVPPSLARAIALEHADVTGSYPWWW